MEEGVPKRVKKAMDIVRIRGNEAAHEARFSLSDDREEALFLFKLVNIIVREVFKRPAEIDEAFEKLPERKKNSVKDRDS